jgi:3-oxoacyl-[acyl-carrier-protein] synthase-3
LRTAPRSLPSSAGIARIAYRLPARRVSLESLRKAGSITSSPRTLRGFGFRSAFVAKAAGEIEDLTVRAGHDVLDGVKAQIGTILFYSGLDSARTRPIGTGRTLAAFRYPAARLAERLQIPRANVMALSQQGCTGLLSALDVAARLAGGSDGRAVLCVSADAIPAGGAREVMYNVMSDAAGAALVDKDAPRNRILAYHQVSEAAYWDTPRLQQELIAAYFPMAKRTILEALDQAGLGREAIRWCVPSNVSLRSWTILADLLDIPMDRIWTRNIERVGHTVSCDHLINLADMEREGALTRGDLLLLFTFGFGASWSVLILSH